MTETDGKLWYLGALTSMPEVKIASKIAEPVLLYDVTLRDGEQTPGVNFDCESRLRIARALDNIGVQRIEAGFPSVSPDDREGVTAIAHAGLNAEVWGFGRCLREDVEINAQCGVKQVLLEISISSWKMNAYGLTPEKVKTRLMDALTRAKELDMRVAFMPVDLTRADLTFAEEVITLAVNKAHVDEIVVVDTIGVATPEAITHLVHSIRDWVDVPLAVHVHNDFGLGLANCLAGLKAGAHCAHVSVNCLGERAGNVDLAEVVMSLQILYGLDLGIKMDKLTDLAQLVEELSGVRLSDTKPIVGRKVFTRESGAVVQQLLSSPPSVEPFDPSIVGSERKVVLGKKSGRYSVIHAMQRLGFTASDAQIDAAVPLIKLQSIKHKRLLTDDEFHMILTQVKDQ